MNMKNFVSFTVSIISFIVSSAQKEMVNIVKEENENKINVFIGQKFFTSFFYPDTLEKPVLYPIHASNGTMITRGFPLHPLPGEPTDHPHHVGLWFNFENVNGLDFWNNSYAIPKEKKHLYGWIKTGKILQATSGATGLLSYQANWTDQKNQVLLEETTNY